MERRLLFWSKLPEARVHESIFGQPSMSAALADVSEHAGTAVAEMVKTHFMRRKEDKRVLSEAERIGQEVGAIGGVLKPGSLTFLDQRRFNNLAIALTRLGMADEAIKAAVEAMDESVLSPARVELLVACAPSADDLEAIAPYDGDPILLARVERFWYTVHKVPHYTNRLLALQAKQQLDGLLSHALSLLEDVGSACAQLSDAPNFARLLALVLTAGNAINAYTPRGSARGCRLDVLPKLADVKSMAAAKGRRLTLLELLVNVAEETMPLSVATWPTELSDASMAARVPWARIRY